MAIVKLCIAGLVNLANMITLAPQMTGTALCLNVNHANIHIHEWHTQRDMLIK